MDINRLPPKEPVVEKAEEQSEDAVKTPTAAQAGIENLDVQEDASSNRPISPALANILNSGPVMEATLMPDLYIQTETAVPFNEDVKLPTELPNGSAVDAGLSAFNIGGRDLTLGPNHFGIDLSAAGLKRADVIGDVLGLHGSSSAPDSSAPVGTGTVSGTGLGAKPGTSLFAEGEVEEVAPTTPQQPAEKPWWQVAIDAVIKFLTDVGIEKFGPPAGAGEAMQLLDGPATVKEVTGDEKDLVRGIGTFYRLNDGEHYNAAIRDAIDDSKNKYVNPDADPAVTSTPPKLTPETLERLFELRRLLNALPSNLDEAAPIHLDPKRVYNPLFSKPLITDRNPDAEDFSNMKSPGEIINPEGPDTVNPNDDVAPPPPPKDIPDTPRGGGGTLP